LWNKDNGGMGSLYRSKHELIFIWKAGNGPHINNVQFERFGRSRTNVWNCSGVNRFGGDRDAELGMHPTIKPVALVADAILDCSKRGGLILDPFIGSGTTIIAAEKAGRRAAAIEIDPAYVDTAIRRSQELTGETALHEKSGLRFSELEQRKQAASSAEHLPNELTGRLEDVP
jgi:DNA modification methylase